MMTIAPFMHYSSIASIVILSGLGASIGQGMASSHAIIALNRQPSVKSEIMRNNLLALALIETASILGFLLAMLLFYGNTGSYYSYLAELSMALAMGIPGFVVGIIAAFPAMSAMQSIARQPFLAKQISNGMILMQSLLQTPLIFGFIIALLIRNQLDSVADGIDATRMIASGLCIALAVIGPAIGSALVTYAACESFGKNSMAYNKIFSFTIINQAIIETPIIFAAVISVWMLQLQPANASIHQAYVYLAAAFCMGIGTFGTGISSGRTVAMAIKKITEKPEDYAAMSRTSIFALGLIDTSAIYVFIVALFLLMVQF